MSHAPRLPYDPALPLVARSAFDRNESTVEAGARVVCDHPLEGGILWRAMLVDCAPADAVPVTAPVLEQPPIVAPPPAAPSKPKQRPRAGA